MRILDVQLFMGSAYHSTSDGQSEVLNRILEDYLRHFVTPSEKDWDQHLCLAEYSYNSSVSTSIGVSPFLLSHGYAPLLPGIPLPPEDTPASTEKLAPRYYGPYRILEVLSPVTYRLQLPASTNACDVLHVNLLCAAIEDDAPCDAEFPTAPELFPFFPATILQVRLYHSRRHRQIQFLVQWDGHPIEEATWEPIDVLYHTPSLADQARALAALVDSSTSDVVIVVDAPRLAAI
ncbi:hypothetical protein O6H91_19G082100 [Diphasiastrum complanatum]|uniref:Uncharacterized protein n=1 Tax=Diphasiastrum complanatum TaxID=34168 RepID=A0ACC2AWZ8_DIPCM|nr:hypothetical protein O6H91_19G082100 [Diphasiastrum complanatum]